MSWDGMFQEAALEPERWCAALGALADATRSTRAQMIGIGAREAVFFNWVTGFSAAEVDGFAELGLASPQFNFRTNAGLHALPRTIVHEQDYGAASERLTSDVYLDYCRDLQISLGCQTSLIDDDGSLVGLALLRSDADGPTDERQRREFAHAAAAARAAVRLQQAIERQGAELLTGAMESMTAPCLLVDGSGRLRLVTTAGEKLLARSDELRLSDGTLTSDDPALARELALALRATLIERSTPRVSLRQGRRLDFFPLHRRPWSLGFAPAAVLVIRDLRAELQAASAVAMARFGLTKAEAAVASLLAEGLSRQEIAGIRRVGEETLRSQIKSVLAKMGKSREAEVVALLNGLR